MIKNKISKVKNNMFNELKSKSNQELKLKKKCTRSEKELNYRTLQNIT